MAEKIFEQVKGVSTIRFFVKDSDNCVGYAYQDVDGFYVFVFNDVNTGSWSDYALLEIGNELKELNREWENEIKKIK